MATSFTSMARRLLPFIATFLLIPQSFAALQDVVVRDLNVVDSRRVGRGLVQYTFTIAVDNPAEPLANVVATVSSASPNTVVIDATVDIGDLDTGNVTPADTFSIRQNRRYRFDPAALTWSISGDTVVTNQAPVAAAGADQAVTAGTTVNLDGSGSSDADNDPLSYAWSLQVPAGSSAVLSGADSATPAFVADVVGTYRASLVVNDGAVNSAPDTVDIVVSATADNAPVIVSSPVLSASANSGYVYDVEATDADAGDTLSYRLNTAPPGMAINNQGLITWLPASAGTADVDLQVTDSTGRSDRQIYLIQVTEPGNQPPDIQPIPDQTIALGQTLRLNAVATDPDADELIFELLAAPAGMVINRATGELVWTPDSLDAATATVAVSDDSAATSATAFSITVVAESNAPPQLAPVADLTVNALSELRIDLDATDADQNDVLTFSISGLPAAIDSTSGLLAWVPEGSDVGVYTVLASVTDSAGASDSDTFQVSVVGPAQPPVARNDSYTVDRRTPLSVPAPGVLANDTDANGDTLVASLVSDPQLGTLQSFEADGGFLYQPPLDAPITVGLELECASAPAMNTGGVSIADVDRDGVLEAVSISGVGIVSEITIVDLETCEVETRTRLPNGAGQSNPDTMVTLVNLDADPELEIVAQYFRFNSFVTSFLHLMAYNIDGSPVWARPSMLSEPISYVGNQSSGTSPVAVDLDNDGDIELVHGYTSIFGPAPQGVTYSAVVVYDGATGDIVWEYLGSLTTGLNDRTANPIVVDLDLDGTLELLWHNQVISHQGELEFQLDTTNTFIGGSHFLNAAIANFDNDPFPEIITVDRRNHTLYQHTGEIIWRIPRTADFKQTLITVAELDGDRFPEYVVNIQAPPEVAPNTNMALNAFDHDGSLLWSHHDRGWQISDPFSQIYLSQPAAFDFDYDGIDELVTQHAGGPGINRGLYIFDGTDGAILASQDLSHPALNQLPFDATEPLSIVDVDFDGAAEIITNFSPADFEPGAVQIWGGLAGNPYPPARNIRNQSIYNPTWVENDGAIPQNIKPHWLIPGLNKFFASPVIPGETAVTRDSFEYVAQDMTADSNIATVDITLSLVNAPTIVSTPPLGASPGFDYRYGALALDADFGDEFTWTLLAAPADMTVSAQGFVEWTPAPADLGAVSVQLLVTDSQGNSDTQNFQLTVAPPVTVPDLVGETDNAAQQSLLSAGLAVGNVTQVFSLTVPMGQVIEQSVGADATSPSGALISYTLSLGPPPAYVPNVAGVSESAAQAALQAAGLVLGDVTFENSDAVPRGVIIRQGVAPMQQVENGDSVDVVVSGGPALVVTLTDRVMTSGSTSAVDVRAFEPDGTLMSPQPVINYTVTPLDGSQGAQPFVDVGVLTTTASTAGVYELTVSATGLGQRVEPFVVKATIDAYFAPVAAYMAQLDELERTYTRLLDALNAGDLIAAQSLAGNLRDSRSALDVATLATRNPFAPATGFLPAAQDLGSFSPTFGEQNVLPLRFATLESAIVDVRTFLERLQAGSTRNDDLRAAFLNTQLQNAGDQLLASSATVGSRLGFNTQAFVLLARLLPELTSTDLNTSIAVLQDAGLLASTQMDDDTRPAFFTLGGMMSATALRTKIIKDVYVSYLTQVISAGLVLAEADLLLDDAEVGNISGLITGGSQSFHVFNRGNSVAELVGVSSDARAFTTTLIGPDRYQASVDFIAGFQRPDSFRGAAELAQGAIDTAGSSTNGTQTAGAGGIENGCIFISAPRCAQLVYPFGFPAVHTMGRFPAPVLMLIQDHASGRVLAGVYAFMPETGN